MDLTLSSCHVKYAFQSESTLYICMNVKEFVARSRRETWRWSDCNCTRTQNHLVLQRTLNHLAKVAKWLSCVLSTYLYGAFACIMLLCHVRISEWIKTLYFPECQGTPWSNQARNLNAKWLQMHSDFAPASSQEFLDIQANIECGFTLKRVLDMTRAYSQMHRTDKSSEHSSIIWPGWPNGWVLV